jgi:N-methylhydantoinase A
MSGSAHARMCLEVRNAIAPVENHTRIGVEIGGTFTDLVMVDPKGNLSTVKVPSTPAAPDQGAMVALRRATGDLEGIVTIVHGSTIATNGVLERKGAPVGLLVTRGFGDILELQRQDRWDVYQLKYRKPTPLVPRAHVREIGERLLADGRTLIEPSQDEVRRAVEELRGAGVLSLAVCFLHAYRYPEHERLVGRWIADEWPDLPVTLSHEITPEYREYERASTAVMSGYVRPIIDEYLGRLEGALSEAGFRGQLHIMQSNGGVLPASLIRRHAIRTLLSGPAGGVTAARAVAAQLGIADLITFDMGGTSTDVCLIKDGKAEVTSESDVDRLPIRVPMFDIVTVGAGGGSIATVDSGGMLRVGPQSAGADPGPACYGRGGKAPTVTDANLLLGLIRPDHFLGGRMTLDVSAAEAVCGHLGRQLGTDAIGAAGAIVGVANAGMLGALRLVSTERGVNPRGYWLLCYGGAGGQHAAALAAELDLRGVIVPRHPGVFSAYGLLIADLRRDWSAPLGEPVGESLVPKLLASVTSLEQSARTEFREAALDIGRIGFEVSLDMRYPGQAFELEIPVTGKELRSPANLAAKFHRIHRQRYGHAADHECPEVVTTRVTAVISQRPPDSVFHPPEEEASGEERVIDVDGTARSVHFYERHQIGRAQVITGPAVIEEEASTVWLPPKWVASLDLFGHLHLEPAR